VIVMIQRPNPVDGCFLTYETSHHDFRPYVGVVLHATGSAPDPDLIRDRIAERIARMPSLACKVAKRGRRTVWALDPRFDPRRHVHEVVVANGSSSPDDAVDTVLSLPLPDDAPRWGVWLIHGYSRREYVLFYRAHHAAQDGQAVLDAVTALFGAGPPIGPRPATVEPPTGRSPWSRPARWATRVRAIPARAIARNAIDLVRDLRPSLTWSPDRPLTGRPRLVSASVPVSRLRETARALGATPNDVCLAALAEAVRTWVPAQWPAHGGRGRDLQVSLPVSVRFPEERYSVGNRVSSVRIPLSFRQESAVDRVAGIARATRRVRTEGMRRVLRAQVDLLPERLLYGILCQSADLRSGLDTSGLIRIPGRLAMGADPIESAAATLFLHGAHPFAVSFLSYGEQVRVGFVIDRALDDVGDLAGLWVDAVERLWRKATPATSPQDAPHPKSAPEPQPMP
jgi:hypothetical protein